MDVEAIIAGLQSAEVDQRRAAAERLARNGADRAVLPLVDACDDVDEQVRELANSALEDAGPPASEMTAPLAARLSRQGLAGYWAATLLGRLGEDAAPAVSALADAVGNNPDASVRQRAAWALGKIGRGAAAAAPALEAAGREGDPRLARLVARALKKIQGDP